MKSWWQIAIEGNEIENLAFEVEGFEGFELLSPTKGTATFLGTRDDAERLKREIEQAGYSVIGCSEQEPQDWQKLVSDRWKPFSLGSFTLVPVLDEQYSSASSPQEIRLIPGAGFGTGESATTQTAFLLLERLPQETGKEILDIGTGSGILAIAYAKLHPDAAITAIDIDDLAISNARENFALNYISSVELLVGTTSSLPTDYDVVIANVEIGIHLTLLPDYARLVRRGGILLLAGLRDSINQEHVGWLLSKVDESAAWEFIDASAIGEWRGFVARRVS